MKKFLIRTLSGAVYVLLMIGAIYAGRLIGNNDTSTFSDPNPLGQYIFGLVFFVIGIIGIHEYLCNSAKISVSCNRPMAYIVGITSYLIIFFWNNYPFDSFRICAIILHTALPALFLTVFLVQLWRHDTDPFSTIGHTLIPTIWIMIPMALTNYLHDTSEGLMMMVFILIWVNDGFAYITGMLLGKHKMWERHSPNKTWEGTIGGALFCIATAVLVGPMFGSCNYLINRFDWIIIGLICSVIGTLGDLVESMFKRHCGVKDSGNIMPGHGGILDRFDSLLLAVPFVQAYLITIQ